MAHVHHRVAASLFLCCRPCSLWQLSGAGTPRFGLQFGACSLPGLGEDRVAVALPEKTPLVAGEALLRAALASRSTGRGRTGSLGGCGSGSVALQRSGALERLGVHSAFAVVDGHGGDACADFAAHHLLPTLLAVATKGSNGRHKDGSHSDGGGEGLSAAEFQRLLQEGFHEVDAAFGRECAAAAEKQRSRASSWGMSGCLPLMCRASAGDVDRRRNGDHSELKGAGGGELCGGACVAAVYIRPVGLAPHFSALEAVAANVGDCRVALLVEDDLHALSVSHTLGAAEAGELERVRNAGCSVGRAVDAAGQHEGPLRVYPGGLVVTRALGDYGCSAAIIPNPSVRSITLPPHCWSRLVVASNGVWSALPQRAVERVLVAHSSAGDAARALADAARARRVSSGKAGLDDTTVVVVDVPPMDSQGMRTPPKPWPLEGAQPLKHYAPPSAPPPGEMSRSVSLVRVASDQTMRGNDPGTLAATLAAAAARRSSASNGALTVLGEVPSRKLGPEGQLEKSYVLESVIGHGKFGIVYAARELRTGREVAVKLVPLNQAKMHKRVCEEIDCLVRISGRHPHLPRVEATYEQVIGGSARTRTLCICSELCAGGTILDFLGARDAIDEALVAQLVAQLLSALAFLHGQSPPIAHRDIKPANIMLRAKAPAPPELVLLDFGLATSTNTADMRAMAGTRFFQAPEMVQGDGYDVAADVWSAGVLLWTLFSGMPAPGAEIKVTFPAIQRGELPTSTPAALSPALLDLLGRMMEPDPKKRITARKALQHEWIVHGLATASEARAVAHGSAHVPSTLAPSDLSISEASSTDDLEGSLRGIQAMQSAGAFETEALGVLRAYLSPHEVRAVMRLLGLSEGSHLGVEEGTTTAAQVEDALVDAGCMEAHASFTLLCYRYGRTDTLHISSAKLAAMQDFLVMYASLPTTLSGSLRGDQVTRGPTAWGGTVASVESDASGWSASGSGNTSARQSHASSRSSSRSRRGNIGGVYGGAAASANNTPLKATRPEPASHPLDLRSSDITNSSTKAERNSQGRAAHAS